VHFLFNRCFEVFKSIDVAVTISYVPFSYSLFTVRYSVVSPKSIVDGSLWLYEVIICSRFFCKEAVKTNKMVVKDCKTFVKRFKASVKDCKTVVKRCKMVVKGCKAIVKSFKASVKDYKTVVKACKEVVKRFKRTAMQNNEAVKSSNKKTKASIKA
jgi:hypothetical protein